MVLRGLGLIQLPLRELLFERGRYPYRTWRAAGQKTTRTQDRPNG